MESAPRLEFRPPRPLRITLGAIGLLTALAAVLLTLRSLSSHQPGGLLVSCLLLTPTLTALLLIHRSYALSLSEFEVTSLGVRSAIPYTGIRWVDDSRGSITIVSAQRPVTVSFLSPGERDRLLHTLVARARLIRSMDPPYGVRARYIPRAEEIKFIPHHARKNADPESGGMVS